MKRTFALSLFAAAAALAGCGSTSDSGAAPGAPTAVAATLGATSSAVVVSFSPPADAGSGPVTGYTVTSTPAGLAASGAASPITVSCGGSCAGRAFAVSATNAAGTGAASGLANVVTAFDVVATFFEPVTQPNDSIFTGTFTLDSTARTVSNLQGSLTQSMTMMGPMTEVSLTHQLSEVDDGLAGNGLLVTTFLLSTVDTFSPDGFDPHNTGGVYFGFPDPWSAATANAYAMVRVDTDDPTATPSQAQLDLLAYADCTEGGMMRSVCMTGTTVAGYGHLGSMDGYPASQVVTKQ